MEQEMVEEHTVAIVSFEGAVKREARRIVETLKKADLGGSFMLDIRVKGPIQESSLKITYELGDDKYDGTSVKGGTSQAVIDEFLRRKGWKATNDPKEITYSGDQEIPF
jgi:hypothetical protein